MPIFHILWYMKKDGKKTEKEKEKERIIKKERKILTPDPVGLCMSF